LRGLAASIVGLLLLMRSSSNAEQPASSPIAGVHVLATQQVTVTIEQMAPPQLHSAAGKPAYRPIDSTFIHDLSAGPDGALWIAPLFNGYQWGGTYERVVRFDPKTKTMAAYKLARVETQPEAVAPVGGQDAWVVNGALIGRFSADGSLSQSVAWDAAAQPGTIAVGGAGDLWVTEPRRVAIGYVSAQSGKWSELDLPLAIGSLKLLDVDSGENVWFASTDHLLIGRLTPASRSFRTFRVPPSLGYPQSLSVDGTRGLWFVADGKLAYVDSKDGQISAWPIPGVAPSSVSAIGRGAFVAASGRLLEFDRSGRHFVRVSLPAGFRALNMVRDHIGGAWIAGQNAMLHVAGQTSRAGLYEIADLDASAPFVAGPDGRVCFPLDGAAACLGTDGTLREFSWSWLPGMIGVATGAGHIWFSERGRLTRVDVSKQVSRFVYPRDAYGPADIAVAPNGTVWAAGHGTIERFTTSGAGTSIPLGPPGSGPFGIATDRQGGVWFAMEHAVGRLPSTGAPAALAIYRAGSNASPEAVALDAHGTAWVTDMSGAIVQIDAGGKMRRHELPQPYAEPFGVTIGPDKAVWFTEFMNDSIGRLDPGSGAIVEYRLPEHHEFPTSIVAADGALWFLELSGFLGRMSLNGEVTEISVPTPSPNSVSPY
jgi:virginiamycin B lyase